MSEPLPLAMKPAKAAKFLGISRSKVYELLSLGALEAKKSNKNVLVTTASMITYFEQLANATFTSARAVERKAEKLAKEAEAA